MRARVPLWSCAPLPDLAPVSRDLGFLRSPGGCVLQAARESEPPT
jgi:hypothetical protein